MVSSKRADEVSIQVSLTLCLIKRLGYDTTVSSVQLTPVLSQLNSPTNISLFLMCDAENRAISTEWLAYSRLQTGSWVGTISSLTDLYIAYNRSVSSSNVYLSCAYRTRARTIVNLFYWLPYDIQFINRAQEISKLDDMLPFISLGDSVTEWDLAWSEAGYRFSML